MTKDIVFKSFPGCYGDGTFGHQHVRERLAAEVSRFDAELAELLRGPMSDDASEEDEALDILNEHTASHLYWAFVDGDLMLVDSTKEDSDV